MPLDGMQWRDVALMTSWSTLPVQRWAVSAALTVGYLRRATLKAPVGVLRRRVVEANCRAMRRVRRCDDYCVASSPALAGAEIRQA